MKHWKIWCIAKGGWVGFYYFLRNIFQITFKNLQNIIILYFLFVKFPWEKYHMPRADEDGWMWMFSLHNEFLLYIFSNANGIEKSDICWQKFLTLFNAVMRSTCCSVRLNTMMKQKKYGMANILSCAIFYSK